ncbi:MAG: DNA polymerase IV [Puniceicoccales bacterium]|nr:DNA polymerase IV [Puniceicoccales bacterium]
MNPRDAFFAPCDNRKIIHVDMDAFFAAIEQRDRPKFRGKPVIVGGDPWDRGVVSTCSYEARPFGVRSGMATHRALRLCPQAVLLPVDMNRYRAVSEEIFDIFRRITPLVEGMSIDEAYLDVTSNSKNESSATRLSQQIKAEIFLKTGLTASAGVSFNMFLAKIASEINKPNGMAVITPDRAAGFLEALPVHRFHGIGRVTANRLHGMNVHTGRDLKRLPMEALVEVFGKIGRYYYEVVRGIDRRCVTPVRVRKSLGRENTFPVDTANLDFLREKTLRLGLEVGGILRSMNRRARAIILKVKFADFSQTTRCRQFIQATDDAGIIANRGTLLLDECAKAFCKKIRLIGVSAHLEGPDEQPSAQEEFAFMQSINPKL